MPELDTKKKRAELPFRRGPYWTRIRKGCYLGYRVPLAGGEGSWMARWRDDEGKQHQQHLGTFDTFDQAKKAAEKWFDHARKTDGAEYLTVEQVCQHYLQKLKAEGRTNAERDALHRFKKRVFGTEFGKLGMEKLRPKHVKAWRDAIPGKPSSINRNLAVLFAAFNAAHRENLVSDHSAWLSVQKISNPGNPRDRWLKADERTRLLDACDPDLRPFVEALMLSAARPGEVATLTVSCVDYHAGTIKIVAGKTGGRTIPASDSLLVLCKAQSRGKLPHALLFSRADGIAWHRDNWQKPFGAAVERAGLGQGIVLYTLRHSAISELVQSGVDAFTVAKIAGTSTTMIDKHYGHLSHTRARELMSSL